MMRTLRETRLLVRQVSMVRQFNTISLFNQKVVDDDYKSRKEPGVSEGDVEDIPVEKYKRILKVIHRTFKICEL